MVRLTFLEKSSYFNRKYRLIRIIYFQKYRNFIGSGSCSNQSSNQGVFHTEICEFCDQRILKIRLFYRIKEFFKVNQIDIPDFQYYLGCNAERMVRLTFLEKSSCFNRKYRLIRLIYFQKYRNFIGSGSCSNQSSNQGVFHTEICEFRDQRILKIRLSYRIMEFFKVNQIDILDFQYYLGCNVKRTARLTFLEKSSYFNRKYRLIRLIYFQNYRNCIGSRSCSNQNKLTMENPLGRAQAKRNLGIACLGKFGFSFGNLDYFKYLIYKKISLIRSKNCSK